LDGCCLLYFSSFSYYLGFGSTKLHSVVVIDFRSLYIPLDRYLIPTYWGREIDILSAFAIISTTQAISSHILRTSARRDVTTMILSGLETVTRQLVGNKEKGMKPSGRYPLFRQEFIVSIGEANRAIRTRVHPWSVRYRHTPYST
jgi:hypothetical protein